MYNKGMKTAFKCLLTGLLALFISGCAANYAVVTNTYLDRTAPNPGIPAGASFAVLTNKNAPNPLFDNEVKSKIQNLLLGRGYRLVPEDQAQFFATYTYDISGKTAATTRPDIVSGPGIVQHVYVNGSNQAYTIVSPSFSYVTYVTDYYNVYTARLFFKVLDAKAMRESGAQKVVWVGDTINESTNPDLRESIDYLLVATFKFFGTDTGRNREISLSADDKEVSNLRASILPPAAPAVSRS